ncbi:MAG: hypothetical protein MUC91_08520 [Verrucomicrobia bacterium]|nr:hypothetical protein [Verrucomicrobiota bacterium]
MNKRILLLSTAALLLAALPLQADVREGLVAYWPLDTATGDYPTTTPDVVAGNDLTGPIKPSTDVIAGGAFSNCVQFLGSTADYLFFTNAPGADTGLPVGKSGSWTYSLWLKGAAPQADQTCPFGEFSTTDAGGNPRYEMMMYGTGVNTNKLRIFMRSTGGTVLAEAPSPSIVFDDNWHHVAYTYDISAPSNRFRVYVDGVPNYTNSFSLNQGVSFFNCVSIGARVRTSVGLPFTGQVDDVALWSRALSQAEINEVRTNSITLPVPAFAPTITANPVGATNLLVGDSWTMSGTATGTRPFAYQWLKNGTNLPGATAQILSLTNLTTDETGQYRLVITNAGGSATSLVAQITVNAFAAPNVTNGMVAYWPLDTLAGVKTPDLVSAYDMTLINMGGSNLVSGRWGNALSFDKTSSQYTRRVHTAGEALPASSKSNYTVSFWVKAPAASGGWAFCEGSTVNNNPALALGMNANDPRFYWLVRNTGGTLLAGYGVASVWDDNWHHVAWVQRDVGGSAKAQIYIDGALDITVNALFPLGANNSSLGAYYRTGPTLPITGLVDEVAAWERALSPAEVALLATSYITNPPTRLTPLAITSFKSDLPAVAKGDSTPLRWDVPANATQILISGLGDVTSKTVGGVGSTNVAPNATTDYVLTVKRGVEEVKATNRIGVVEGVAANWHLLDNFDFYSPGALAAGGWWIDLGGGSSVSVVTPTNCNRMVKTVTTGSAAYLRLNNLTVNSNQSSTLFFRMIPTTNDAAVTRNYVGITDRPGNFQYQYTGGNIGPAVYPTINDPALAPDGTNWLMSARDIPTSPLTFATNVLEVGSVYNVWIDVTNVFIGDRVFPDNYDVFSVYLQKEGDAARTALFTNFTSDRDLLSDDPLTGGLPTDPLTRIFLCGNRTDYSALFDDFYLSTSGYNATVPRAVGYAGLLPTLRIEWSGSQWQVVFDGKLQEASAVNGTWSEVSGAASPYPVSTTGDQKYYRAVCY